MAGFLSGGLKFLERAASVTTEHRGELAIRSPWQVGELNSIVFEDVFGVASWELSREEALTIPAVFRARAILLSLIADKPLAAFRGSTRLPQDDQPTFTYRTPGQLGPWQRMAATLDDLIFEGWSLWLTERGERVEGRRPILNAVHCPFSRWTIDDKRRICLIDEDGHETPQDEDDVLLIPGPSEGLRAYAARTLRGAANLESSWVQRAQNPIPMVDLHDTVENNLTRDERMEVVQDWNDARRTGDGSTASTPYSIEARALGTVSPDLYIEGRNASRLDVAAFFNLPGAILDATTAQASLTYVTQEGTRSSVYDLSTPYWIRPIEDRLSQDDVVPRGQSVRFDFTSVNVPDRPRED